MTDDAKTPTYWTADEIDDLPEEDRGRARRETAIHLVRRFSRVTDGEDAGAVAMSCLNYGIASARQAHWTDEDILTEVRIALNRGFRESA